MQFREFATILTSSKIEIRNFNFKTVFAKKSPGNIQPSNKISIKNWMDMFSCAKHQTCSPCSLPEFINWVN